MPDKTPRTKSAILQETGQRSEETRSIDRSGDKQKPEPRPGPPPAQETNEIHPAAPGVHSAVPGAGVVGAEADVYPNETSPGATAHRGRAAPGAGPCDAPQAAPHGRPRGTTISGVSSTPSQGGAGVVDTGDSAQATEAVTGGGAAPLNPPTPDLAGPPPEDEVPGLADPNFTARKYSDKGSPVGSADRGGRRRGGGGGGSAKRK